MLTYILPIALVILSNVVYHICAKSVPTDLNPFVSMTVTYLTGAVVAFALFLLFGKGTTVPQEIAKINWVPFAFGFAVVGLEVGNLFAYRAGWQISSVAIVQSAFVAVILLIVGYFLFREQITWNKVVGIIICLVGLGFINFKF